MPDFQPPSSPNSANISPQLFQWIEQQRQAGIQDDHLLSAMLAAGWNKTLAGAALQSSDRKHQARSLNRAAALPEPDLSAAPGVIAAGEQQVRVLMSMTEPRVVLFSQLLSDAECATIIAAARPRLARSLTVQTSSGGEEINPDRTSDGMFFQRGEIPVVAQLEQRIAQLLNWPVENGEGLQVLRYGPGTEYKPHHDYFDPAEPGSASILRRGGQRVGTLLIYLNAPQQGGATVFPEVRLQFTPQRDHAVFFSYDRPHPQTRTLHGGAPVIEGEKWIATKWLRERRFD